MKPSRVATSNSTGWSHLATIARPACEDVEGGTPERGENGGQSVGRQISLTSAKMAARVSWSTKSESTAKGSPEALPPSRTRRPRPGRRLRCSGALGRATTEAPLPLPSPAARLRAPSGGGWRRRGRAPAGCRRRSWSSWTGERKSRRRLRGGGARDVRVRSRHRGDGWGEDKAGEGRRGGFWTWAWRASSACRWDRTARVGLLLMSSEMSLWSGRTLLIYSAGHQD